jgi:hypothetical protein
MDQNDLTPYIHSLPLYVASCNDLLCFETPDYNSRAWCSVERVIAYSFMFSGKIPWVIEGGYELTEEVLQKGPVNETRLLSDPRKGALTNEADRPHVEDLMKIAEHSHAWTGGDGRALDLGATTVDAWAFCSASSTNINAISTNNNAAASGTNGPFDLASSPKPALKTAGSMIRVAGREATQSTADDPTAI